MYNVYNQLCNPKTGKRYRTGTKKQKRKWSLKKQKKNEIYPWIYLSSRSERKGVKKTLTSMFPCQLRVAWIMTPSRAPTLCQNQP